MLRCQGIKPLAPCDIMLAQCPFRGMARGFRLRVLSGMLMAYGYIWQLVISVLYLGPFCTVRLQSKQRDAPLNTLPERPPTVPLSPRQEYAPVLESCILFMQRPSLLPPTPRDSPSSERSQVLITRVLRQRNETVNAKELTPKPIIIGSGEKLFTHLTTTVSRSTTPSN